MCAVRDDVIGFERSMALAECSMIRRFRGDLRRICKRGGCVISAEAMASLGGFRTFAALCTNVRIKMLGAPMPGGAVDGLSVPVGAGPHESFRVSTIFGGVVEHSEYG